METGTTTPIITTILNQNAIISDWISPAHLRPQVLELLDHESDQVFDVAAENLKFRICKGNRSQLTAGVPTAIFTVAF